MRLHNKAFYRNKTDEPGPKLYLKCSIYPLYKIIKLTNTRSFGKVVGRNKKHWENIGISWKVLGALGRLGEGSIPVPGIFFRPN